MRATTPGSRVSPACQCPWGTPLSSAGLVDMLKRLIVTNLFSKTGKASHTAMRGSPLLTCVCCVVQSTSIAVLNHFIKFRLSCNVFNPQRIARGLLATCVAPWWASSADQLLLSCCATMKLEQFANVEGNVTFTSRSEERCSRLCTPWVIPAARPEAQFNHAVIE